MKKFIQIAIIVEDIESAAREWAELLNVPVPEIRVHQILDDNPSTYNEFIKEHGYGVHHLGFAVGDRRDAVVNELVDRGYQKRVEHIYPSGSWTIIDSEQSLGVNLNIKPAM